MIDSTTPVPASPATYPDFSDAQLVCAYRHGWTAKHYIGHGISDRADASRRRLVEELKVRGLDIPAPDSVRWGTCDCDVPRHPATGYPMHEIG